MKAVLLCLAATMLTSVAAVGQGQFVFNNHVPSVIDARFQNAVDNPGFSSLTGDAYTVQVFGGPAGSSDGDLIPLTTTDFRPAAEAGYVNPVTVTVPGVRDGSDAVILLAVLWRDGPSVFRLYTYGPFNVAVAETPNSPRYLPLGTNPLVPGLVPEPPPMRLGLLGFGMVLLWGWANNRVEQNRRSALRFRSCADDLTRRGGFACSVPTAVAHPFRSA